MKHHEKKKKMKKGGHVEGHKGKHRLDKMARGGAMKGCGMTPDSPLSGAGNMKDAPKSATTDKEND